MVEEGSAECPGVVDTVFMLCVSPIFSVNTLSPSSRVVPLSHAQPRKQGQQPRQKGKQPRPRKRKGQGELSVAERRRGSDAPYQ